MKANWHFKVMYMNSWIPTKRPGAAVNTTDLYSGGAWLSHPDCGFHNYSSFIRPEHCFFLNPSKFLFSIHLPFYLTPSYNNPHWNLWTVEPCGSYLQWQYKPCFIVGIHKNVRLMLETVKDSVKLHNFSIVCPYSQKAAPDPRKYFNQVMQRT